MIICEVLQFELQNLTKNCENFAKLHMKIYNCKIQPTSLAFIFINMKVVGKAKLWYD